MAFAVMRMMQKQDEEGENTGNASGRFDSFTLCISKHLHTSSSAI